MSIKWKQTHTNPKWVGQIKDKYSKNYIAEVGYPERVSGVLYPSVRPEYDTGAPPPRVTDVAYQNEIGDGVPARPFMKLSKEGIVKVFKVDLPKQMKKVNRGVLKPIQLVEAVAAKATGVIQRTIVQLSSPPNSERTVEIKKSSNPLIDTGLMRQTATWEVKEGSIDKSGGG